MSDDPTRGSELDATRASPPGEPETPRSAATDAGEERIGPYRILRILGEGGMGSVLLAEQTEPVQRRVALKVIKLGMDTREVVARFEAERQALAVMDHPNIARVLDAGATERGRPFFVMELVQGVPITTYCDQHRLTTRERLELFVPVCMAVQHAHQKGVIHRDLKPANVLVSVQGNEPVPKIIDFGIAKAIDRRLTEKTLHTAHGQFIGTPHYMSPEQAEMSGLDVDTRTDVYSLGVLLYELLTGRLPFDREKLNAGGFAEIARMIRDTEAPRPSTRVGTTQGQRAEAIGERRQTDLKSLGRDLRGDLDWIILKAIEKDRTRRYETANGLAVDIERHLRDAPVSASPPSVGYRTSKFIRRHRFGVAAGAAIALALVAGVTLATIGLLRATRAEQLASAEAAKARAVSDFLRQTLKTADPLGGQGGHEVTVVETLEAAVPRLTSSFEDQPAVRAALRETVGTTFLGLGRLDEAEAQLRLAVEESRAIDGGGLETAAALDGLGEIEFYRDDLDAAERRFEEALEIRRDLLGDDHPDTIFLLNNLATVYTYKERYEEAESLYRDVVDRLPRHADPADPRIATQMLNLASVLRTQKKFDEAAGFYQRSLEHRRRYLGPDHPEVAVVLGHMAGLYRSQDRCEQALPFIREALGIYSARLEPEH